jgi:hypothetical protein
MRNLRLSAAALILLTGLVLAAPLAAMPPDCDVACTCTTRCSMFCSIDGGITRCGDFGICAGECLVAADKTRSSDSFRDAIFAEASPTANQPQWTAPAR